MKQKYDIFFQYLSKIMCASLFFYFAYFMIWTIFFTETGNGDNVEHIHSTWLVSQGKVPYKDFFQHHNPLMWYIFAPFIGFIDSTLLLLDIAHIIGLLAGIVTFIYVYKISVMFFASQLASATSLLILCPPFFYIFCFNFNPDIFMILAYVIGLYYLFLYWQTPKLFSLVVSFFSFFLAFMFTQKILIALGTLGFCSLFIFYYKKTSSSDILYALLLPILLLGLFLVYLHSKEALGLYWKTNYLFNMEMQDYYGNIKTQVFDIKFLEPALILAFISVCVYFIKGNIYIRLVSIMFILEILQRYFYFSIASYYMLPTMVYAVLLNSVLIDSLIKKKKEIIIIFLCLATYYAFISKNKYLIPRGTDRAFATYMEQNITPCDYVLSSFLGIQSIKNKDMHYYWALLGHIDMAGEKMGLQPKPHVTNLVKHYLPKFIYGGVYYNNYYYNRGRRVFVQKVEDGVIYKYYSPTPFTDFYILKPEYRRKNCTYNHQKGDWEYAD